MTYDAMMCHKNTILTEEQVKHILPQLLKDFYDDVNEYFAHGIDNYNSGYMFHFAFTIVTDNMEETDEILSAMIQYTTRRKEPQDICYQVFSKKLCRIFTDEFVLPAHLYLTYKCRNLGYEFVEACDRYYGAPAICVPKKTIDPATSAPVTKEESPKLYDGMFTNNVATSAEGEYTSVFSK